MRVFCISGVPGSGKEEVAETMRRILWGYGCSVLILHLRDLPEFICKQVFHWDGKPGTRGQRLYAHTVDSMREYDPEYFRSYITTLLRVYGDHFDYVFITDMDSVSDVAPLYAEGFHIRRILVERPGYFSQQPDDETPAASMLSDNASLPDYVIHNDDGGAKLTQSCLEILDPYLEIDRLKEW